MTALSRFGRETGRAGESTRGEGTRPIKAAKRKTRDRTTIEPKRFIDPKEGDLRGG
jgi:hypothetical protein